jgi:Fe-S-cluster-containing dehydrogenase component/CRP-like cAMP-binding protein
VAQVVNPLAGLPTREGDEHPTPRQLEKLSLFTPLKKKPSFAKFPGAVVLRKYAAGETIVRMGDAGWTAFYILTTDDLLALRQAELQAVQEQPDRGQRRALLEQQISELVRRKESLAAADPETQRTLNQAVTALLPLDRRDAPARPSGWRRLLGVLQRPSAAPAEEVPAAIASDGPCDLDGQTRSAAMYEGELFGEMSCMTRMPRAATVLADRDVYLLEMLGNVLEMVLADEGYRVVADRVYRERAMNLQLRRLPIIGQLEAEPFRQIQERAELETFEPGTVVWDEHDPADSFCLVRGGLVKVVRGLHFVLGPEDVPPPQRITLCQDLAEGAESPVSPWRLLNEAEQAAARQFASGNADPANWESVRNGLNTLIKGRQAVKQFAKTKKTELLAAAGIKGLDDLPEKVDDWTELDVRQFNRLWLEACCPAGIPPRRCLAVRQRTLAYVGRGEYFGESCVLPDRFRSGTCIAYSHPDTGQSVGGGRGATPSRLELVRIRRQDLLDVLSPQMQEQIADVARGRMSEPAGRASRAAADATLDPLHPHFEQLGLLQGQKLMLIDLDRCTRCGDCVRACINTHTDGASRLFLDGPRFGNYLVANTCRQCLDPVCMIGCPVRSIVRGEDGQIEIKNWCIGCRACSDQCPYGSIHMHELTGLANTVPPPPAPAALFDAESAGEVEVREVMLRAVVCDQCANSPLGEPACVYHCPHDAAMRLEGRSLLAGVP